MLGIFFDLDGTLIDSLEDICFHVNRVRCDYGLHEHPVEFLHPFIGKGVEHLLLHGISEVVEDIGVAKLRNDFRSHYAEQPGVKGAPYPGVVELLSRLRTRPDVRLGVVTNKSTTIAEKTLQHYLPQVVFDAVSGPEVVSFPKPRPEHLLETLEKCKVQKSEALFVGDHAVDQACAQAAGVKFLGAAYGFGGVQVTPEERLECFSDLWGHIASFR
jgi:phosphoglycolate phosphatase